MPSTPPHSAPIPAEILRILRCPLTGSPLRVEGDQLIAETDPSRRYSIDHGVPVLLPSSSKD